MGCNFGNAMACSSQSWDWLENEKSEDDEVSRRVWKVVETKAEKNGVAKTKRRRKEIRRERSEEEGRKKNKKTKEGENNRDKKGRRRMEDLEWGG